MAGMDFWSLAPAAMPEPMMTVLIRGTFIPYLKKFNILIAKSEILIVNLIYSRSLEARTDSRLSAAAQAASAEAKGQKPPPRPIHRYPSWEDRIYQVASEGMKDATGDQMGDSKNNNQDQQNGYGSDINVPVYATVKGVSHKVVHREILKKILNMNLHF